MKIKLEIFIKKIIVKMIMGMKNMLHLILILYITLIKEMNQIK